jgi:hypothetical protein
MLGDEDVEALGELLHEGEHDRRAARAVQEDERPALAAAPQVDLAAGELDEAVVELHASARRFFFSTPDSSITTGISAKFIGAMMCAPAMPGISASSRRISMQTARPSRRGSAAFSRRSTIASGMRVPKSYTFNQRAERAEGIGATPIRIGSPTPASSTLAA